MALNDKKIDIFGTTYNIKYVDEIEAGDKDRFFFGRTKNCDRLIEIARTANGSKIPESELKITLYHELMHAFLMEGGYIGYNEDEPLVEWLARCINAAVKQNII